MDADPRLTEVTKLLADYHQSHTHPSAFACCSAHAVADEVPGLFVSVYARDAEIAELRAMLKIVERRNEELADTLAERDEEIAGLLADEVELSDDQAGVPA